MLQGGESIIQEQERAAFLSPGVETADFAGLSPFDMAVFGAFVWLRAGSAPGRPSVTSQGGGWLEISV